MTAIRLGPPEKQGLYDPQFEHDACGVGFVVDIKGRKSNAVVKQGIQILKNLDHRGASGSEVNTGDGAGILMQLPHAFLKKVAKKDARSNLPEPGHYAAGSSFMRRNATQRRRDARRERVRAQALRDPQARVQRDPRVDDRWRGVLVRGVPEPQDSGLQG